LLIPYIQESDKTFVFSDYDLVGLYLSESLTTSQFKDPNEPSLLENPTIVEIAHANGFSSAQVFIRWAIQGGTSVILKSVNPARLKQNFDSAAISLSDKNMEKIAALEAKRRLITGKFWDAPELGYSVATLWDE
jgi:alcohol dehydrogenase (NADP+)